MIVFLLSQLYKAIFPQKDENRSTELSNRNSPQPNASQEQQSSSSQPTVGIPAILISIIRMLMDWITLILMMVLPSTTSNYALVFGIVFGVGSLIFIYNGYRYHVKQIKIFPKVLELGILLINLAMLIFEVVQKPSYHWSRYWTSVITSSCLFGLVTISMIIGKPFTLQFAMEAVDEKFWSNPNFLLVNYHITFVWWLDFGFSIMFSLLSIYVYPNNSAAKTAPGIILLILALLFTKKYPEYVRGKARNATALSKNQDSVSEENNDSPA